MKRTTSIIGLVLLMAFSVNAQFVNGPRKGQGFNSASAITIGANQSSNLVSSLLLPYYLDGVDELSFYTEFVAAGANTQDLHFIFEVTADGTVWFTPDNAPSTLTRAITGTTAVRSFTNHWQGADLRSVRAIRLKTITNGAAVVYVTNATFYQR